MKLKGWKWMLTDWDLTTTTLPGERNCWAVLDCMTASDTASLYISASEAMSKYSSIAGSPFMHLTNKSDPERLMKKKG